MNDDTTTNPEKKEVTEAEAVSPLDELQTELETLTTDLQAEKEKAIRALADLENYRRRETEAKAQWGTFAVGGFLKNVLPAFNALQMAVAHTDDEPMQKVIAALFESLTKSGLTAIAPEAGDVVNPDQHEVLMAAEGAPGTIVQVLEPGWAYNGAVLTPAKVSAAPEA